jgi:hypothetical protein
MMVFIMQCYLPASEQELVIPSTWEDVLEDFDRQLAEVCPS